MRVKKGDNVAVISGKDKGKSGKVLRAIPGLEKVLVESGYLEKKKPKRGRQKKKKEEHYKNTGPSN